MFTKLLNRTCVIKSRSASLTGAIDAFGNEVPDEVTVNTVCELQQRQRREHDQEGEVADDLWDCFFLPGTVLKTGDEVLVGGLAYEVVGTPWSAINPRSGVAHHIEASLRRTAGPEEAV